MKSTVQEIRRLREERKGASLGLARFLVAKGVMRSIAEEIAQEFIGGGIDGLKRSMAKRIHVAPPLQLPTSLALIGPTGVGKTTTLIKLALYYRALGHSVAVLSLESGKQARFEEWQIPYFEGVDSLPLECDLTLIDCAGCNFYQPHRVDELGELLAACAPTQIHLTLSAATKDVDLYGAIHQFSPLVPTHLIFTKLDETLASGVLLNICHKTELPIRFIAYGYPLPGSIELADPERITHKILTDFNHQEFQLLRQLIVE